MVSVQQAREIQLLRSATRLVRANLHATLPIDLILAALEDEPQQGPLVEERLARGSRFSRGHRAISVGISTEEETADQQVTRVNGFLLRDAIVIVRVGKLEQQLAGVFQILDRVPLVGPVTFGRSGPEGQEEDG